MRGRDRHVLTALSGAKEHGERVAVGDSGLDHMCVVNDDRRIDGAI